MRVAKGPCDSSAKPQPDRFLDLKVCERPPKLTKMRKSRPLNCGLSYWILNSVIVMSQLWEKLPNGLPWPGMFCVIVRVSARPPSPPIARSVSL